MRWQVLAIGKPKLRFAATGMEEYLRRLGPMTRVEVDWLRAGTQTAESEALRNRSEGLFRIVLDERGEEVTSQGLADRITGWEQRSVKAVALLVGGADGHREELRQVADWRWSLSRLTLQHEMALLLALEQVYRAYTIKAGLPYHRE
jgi:23S rRNA (pseudouridine1915-N3)-methyltransferase